MLEAASFFEYAAAGGLRWLPARRDRSYPAEYPTACSPQAWATGTPLTLLTVIFGLEPKGSRLNVDPVLPPAIGQIQLRAVPGRWGHVDVSADAVTSIVAALESVAATAPNPVRELFALLDANSLPITELEMHESFGFRLGDAGDWLLVIDSGKVRVQQGFETADCVLEMTGDTLTARADAPWCPSNIEFIRRINGLDSIDEVKRIVFAATYLVLGLGDVYLGAPVATPVDPRHRLVTTKYNPARTWTPDNVVGIGGAYLCIYGMEGPGGYQLFGRTCQMWNTYRVTGAFEPGKPWLLRFFDQIKFYAVSGEELSDFRDGFLEGKRHIEIIPARFRVRDYLAFVDAYAEKIAAFKTRQQAAFDAERARWQMTPETDEWRWRIRC